MGNDFTTSLLNGFGGGPAYGDSAASGDPSGYKAAANTQASNAIVVGLVIVFVAILLVLGVVALRVSGEIVI